MDGKEIKETTKISDQETFKFYFKQLGSSLKGILKLTWTSILNFIDKYPRIALSGMLVLMVFNNVLWYAEYQSKAHSIDSGSEFKTVDSLKNQIDCLQSSLEYEVKQDSIEEADRLSPLDYIPTADQQARRKHHAEKKVKTEVVKFDTLK
jgi:hypothetical protein